MSFDLEKVRAEFPALQITDAGKPRYYFDNPAGTQVPQRVVDAVSHCLLEANANLGGDFASSRFADKVVEGARAAMADFLNAPETDEIIFGQNMTTMTLHLSRSIGRHLKADDEIILSRMDHDANVQPWVLMARDFGLKVRWLSFDTDSFEFDLAQLDKLLNERTRLVCIGGASNLLGTINDITEISRRARAAGAWTFVDAVQSVPHVTTDVQAIGCDFLACSAYKFFGRAALVFRDRHPEPRRYRRRRGGSGLFRVDWRDNGGWSGCCIPKNGRSARDITFCDGIVVCLRTRSCRTPDRRADQSERSDRTGHYCY